MTVTELLIPPSPVDWRLYDHEVMMGWKTPEDIQDRVDLELPYVLRAVVPDGEHKMRDLTRHAYKYLGLSKIPGLVETLLDELKADRTKKVVLFFETRDVGMALRDALKAVHAVLLFKGTPDSQRAKRLKDFTTKGWCRVAVVAMHAAPRLWAHDMIWVELSHDPAVNRRVLTERAASAGPMMEADERLVLLAGTVDETLMRQRWAATTQLLEGVHT